MKKGRLILNLSAIAVLAVFIICTFVSAYIERYMQTVVEFVIPKNVFVEVDGATAAFPLVPVSAIIQEANRNYVYVVESRRGAFGEEYNVYKAEVGILEEEDGNAVLVGKNINLSNRIVLNPTNLADGQSVRLEGAG